MSLHLGNKDPVKRKAPKKKGVSKKKFIQKAIKRPGKLTKLVGAKPSENMAKVR